MDQFATFLEKRRSTREGTLRGRSLVLDGSSLSDGNEHGTDPLPVVLGDGTGPLEI
jgi:hypothetical protein